MAVNQSGPSTPYFSTMAANQSGPSTPYFSAIAGNQSGPATPYFSEFLDETSRRVANIIMEYVVCFTLGLLGIVTNILVIIVYAKQGFKESVAISMTTIAVWDLIKSIAGVMERFSGILSLWDPAVAFSWSKISVVAFNYLICFSSYVTSVMAAYVAVERCLCVSVPLKVKWLLTPRVTLTACLIISFVVFGAFAVMFGIYDIVWEWNASFNATVAIYKKNAFYIRHDEPLFAYYNLSGILWPLAAFVVIVVATIIIVHKLRQGSKFRAAQTRMSAPPTSSSGMEIQERQPKQQPQLSTRDRQVVKMLLVIIFIYILCLSPRISLYMAKHIIYDFYFLRRYHDLFKFVLYWLWLADLCNGAVNFFVFYSMSSSFRVTFRALFTSATSATAATAIKS
ncbi:chemosensory receptor A [Elysia marginata]|uniref:Chemosensory receptor A n=1 Tax=Elysia marginata TaxID=1093978 RepID=A0AAV4IGQ5_9GAST|nr:chemosensory receptor A [Elysia marginata]